MKRLGLLRVGDQTTGNETFSLVSESFHRTREQWRVLRGVSHITNFKYIIRKADK